MKALVIAIHGIMTRQSDPSWPDKLDAYLALTAPDLKVLKKKYRAGPFRFWNCWLKDPWLARSLAKEVALFLPPPPVLPALQHSSTPSLPLSPPLQHSTTPLPPSPPIWFVAHSNGAVIALLTAKRLIAAGYPIGGLILSGAACEADLEKNHLMEWYCESKLGAAIAYSSPDDHLLGLPARLLWPYGSLGRTGWLWDGEPFANLDGLTAAKHRIFTLSFRGGHSTYFSPQNINYTFHLIRNQIAQLSSL
jgi:hypothetical protein